MRLLPATCKAFHMHNLKIGVRQQRSTMFLSYLPFGLHRVKNKNFDVKWNQRMCFPPWHKWNLNYTTCFQMWCNVCQANQCDVITKKTAPCDTLQIDEFTWLVIDWTLKYEPRTFSDQDIFKGFSFKSIASTVCQHYLLNWMK